MSNVIALPAARQTRSSVKDERLARALLALERAERLLRSSGKFRDQDGQFLISVVGHSANWVRRHLIA